MRHKGAVIAVAVCVLVFAFGFIAPNLGSEFVPTLSEGAIAINVVRLADTPIERSIEDNTKIEQAVLKSFPEMGTPRSCARLSSAGVSTHRFGAPFANGTPSMMAA